MTRSMLYTEKRFSWDAYRDIGGTTPGMGKVELRRDTHMDVSGRVESGTETEQQSRATQDAKAEGEGTTPWMGDDSTEGGGRERPEHVLEVELRRDTHMDVSGRVESGTETEQQPRVESGRL